MFRAVKVLGLFLAGLLVLAETALALTMTVAAHTDHTFLIITGGSMEPTYHLGSGLLIKDLPTKDVVPGTVVTFRSAEGTLTTHRVIARKVIGEQTYVQTQGDANPEPDPNFSDIKSVIGTPVAAVPNGGYVATFLLSPLGRFVVFVPPLLILLLVELRMLRAYFIKNPTPDPEGGDDTTTDTDGGRSTETSPHRRPRLPALLSTSGASTIPIVVAVLVLSVFAGTLISRTTALFTAAADATANTVSTATLQPPTGLTATATPGQTNLSWTATTSTAATGYDILRGTTTGGPYTLIGSVVGRTTTTYADTTAVGTVYYVVRSTVQNWWSPGSTQTSANSVPLAWTTTPWANCTANAADTGGDGNGFQTTPANACGDPNGAFASDANSGTSTSMLCTDTGHERHRFFNYGFTIPAGTSIGGIEVQTLGRHDKNGTAGVCIQLSGDNGVTWTAAKSNLYTNRNVVETLTFGGSADLWGTTWTPASTTNGRFVVRVINIGAATNRKFDLDSVQVRTTYR